MGICSEQHSTCTCIRIPTAYLILPVMALSLAVLFHRDIMSSVGLTEITAPHISLPTINCSPSIASSYDSRKKIAPQSEHTITCLMFAANIRDPLFSPDTILPPSCSRGTVDDTQSNILLGNIYWVTVWLTLIQKFELRPVIHPRIILSGASVKLQKYWW